MNDNFCLIYIMQWMLQCQVNDLDHVPVNLWPSFLLEPPVQRKKASSSHHSIEVSGVPGKFMLK